MADFSKGFVSTLTNIATNIAKQMAGVAKKAESGEEVDANKSPRVNASKPIPRNPEYEQSHPARIDPDFVKPTRWNVDSVYEPIKESDESDLMPAINVGHGHYSPSEQSYGEAGVEGDYLADKYYHEYTAPGVRANSPQDNREQLPGYYDLDSAKSGLEDDLRNQESTKAENILNKGDYDYDSWLAQQAGLGYVGQPEDQRDYYDMVGVSSLSDTLKDEGWRRTRDANGNVKNISDMNLLGFTSQNKTGDAALRAYEAGFKSDEEEGYRPENPISETLTEEDYVIPTAALVAINPDLYEQDGKVYSLSDPTHTPIDIESIPNPFPKTKVVDENMIDDGASPTSREALYMSGAQYIHYRDKFGIPGRPVNEIDPNGIYNKQEEQDQYGFIPYLVSDEGLSNFHDTAGLQAVNNQFRDLAELRRNSTDYKINYDGKSYSGKDFENGYIRWHNSLDENAPLYSGEPHSEWSIPYVLYAVDDNGNKIAEAPRAGTLVHIGEDGVLYSVDPANPPDGPCFMYFGDTDDPRQLSEDFSEYMSGTRSIPKNSWMLDSYDDVKRNLSYQVAGEGETPIAWRDMDPYTLSDGTQIRADKAENIAMDMDRYSDYGPMGIANPNPGDPLSGGSFVPWFVDMALGSAPLFNPVTAGVQAVANTGANLSGMRAGRQMGNGTYSLVSANPTREQQLLTSLGSAALPATERIWGSIGHNLLNPATARLIPGWKALVEKNPQLAKNPLAVFGLGAAGEALEEIPGNFVEELQRTGSLGSYFANPMYYQHDETGARITGDDGQYVITADPSSDDPAVDRFGNQIYNQDTGLLDRAWNFAEDIPLSMLGGATLGGAMGIPGAVALSARNKADREASKQRKTATGYDVTIPSEVQEYIDLRNLVAPSNTAQTPSVPIRDLGNLDVRDRRRQEMGDVLYDIAYAPDFDYVRDEIEKEPNRFSVVRISEYGGHGVEDSFESREEAESARDEMWSNDSDPSSSYVVVDKNEVFNPYDLDPRKAVERLLSSPEWRRGEMERSGVPSDLVGSLNSIAGKKKSEKKEASSVGSQFFDSFPRFLYESNSGNSPAGWDVAELYNPAEIWNKVESVYDNFSNTMSKDDLNTLIDAIIRQELSDNKPPDYYDGRENISAYDLWLANALNEMWEDQMHDEMLEETDPRNFDPDYIDNSREDDYNEPVWYDPVFSWAHHGPKTPIFPGKRMNWLEKWASDEVKGRRRRFDLGLRDSNPSSYYDDDIPF